MSGKLTAEQVREIVERHWHDLPADYDMPEAAALPEYSYDWQAIADELNAERGSDAKPCYAADENYKRCKYSVNRGWCDDAPFLVWDDTGHLFITMGGLKTWDVTDDAKKWFAELESGTCEYKPMWNDDDLLNGEYVGMWYTGCGDALVWNTDNDGCCKPPAFCPYCGGAVKVVSA